jgi:hypothetical protein
MRGYSKSCSRALTSEADDVTVVPKCWFVEGARRGLSAEPATPGRRGMR